MKKNILYFFITLFLTSFSCKETDKKTTQQPDIQIDTIIYPGAYSTKQYLPLLENKKVALVVNHTSLVDRVHLVDTLISEGIEIKKIFAPEHGFRGNIERGKNFDNFTDSATGLPVISLIGKHKSPTEADLKDVDIVVYDLQDVGVRFFTYISTMFLVMKSCAENNVEMIILDRPNPNGDYVAGPVLDTAQYRSFVGMLPIPVVYGMTPGELALMINGENWLGNGLHCNLKIIKVKNYTHSSHYELPVKPSPNLPNWQSIRLYPSLCFFEATDFSVGRGTDFPFQVVGYPDKRFGDFVFVPHDIKGVQTNPIQKGKKCYGIDLRNINPPKFTWEYVINFYNISKPDIKFFIRPRWFDLLAGNGKIRKMIEQGKNISEIKSSYKKELDDFKEKRKKYLIYPL